MAASTTNTSSSGSSAGAAAASIRALARRGRLDSIVDHVGDIPGTRPRRHPRVDAVELLAIACEEGRHDIVTWLMDKESVRSRSATSSAVVSASLARDAELVGLMVAEFNPSSSSAGMRSRGYALEFDYRNAQDYLTQMSMRFEDFAAAGHHRRAGAGANDQVHIALLVGCAAGCAEVVEAILANPRVDAGAYDNFALALAAHRNRTGIARILLADSRVDPNAGGKCAMRHAAANGNVDLVDAFLAHAALDAAWIERVVADAVHNGHKDVVAHIMGDTRVGAGVDGLMCVSLARNQGWVPDDMFVDAYAELVARCATDGRRRRRGGVGVGACAPAEATDQLVRYASAGAVRAMLAGDPAVRMDPADMVASAISHRRADILSLVLHHVGDRPGAVADLFCDERVAPRAGALLAAIVKTAQSRAVVGSCLDLEYVDLAHNRYEAVREVIRLGKRATLDKMLAHPKFMMNMYKDNALRKLVRDYLQHQEGAAAWDRAEDTASSTD